MDATPTRRRARPSPAPQSISSFALFGEQHGEIDAEFVHVEDISARSHRYDWQITPHRHQGMFQLVHIAEGKAEVRLDQSLHDMAGPCAITIPSAVVHAFAFQPGTTGWVMTIAELQISGARGRGERELLGPLLAEPRILAFEAGGESAALMAGILRQLQRELALPGLGSGDMLEWLIRIVLMTARRQLDAQVPLSDANARQLALYNRMRALIEDRFREHWPVTAYADALALSQVQLNRLCRAMTGKGAGELIQDRLVLEAKRNLIYAAASIAVVGYELGFQDPAYFSRFFKRRTGMSPSEFREARLAGSRSD